ncbi:MAG TPA: ABC transporter substrate-binding protein, partial [Candidatus Limnocylindrales bacterium]|nr:ABC transporter substrate-binding protein [Candidatus Limnocylindrales bacterium]
VDFKPQLTKIKASGADAIVMSALVAEGAPIMVQARQLGITLPFIGGNGMNSPRVFELAKDNSDNLWVGSPWSVENPVTENKRFIAAYQKAHGTLPDQFAAQAYDAMYIAAQALKKIKLTGQLEALANRQTVLGRVPGQSFCGADFDLSGAGRARQNTEHQENPENYDSRPHH